MGFTENQRPVEAILECGPGDGPQTFEFSGVRAPR